MKMVHKAIGLLALSAILAYLYYSDASRPPLHTGMSLEEARKILSENGCEQVEGAYPLPWHGEGEERGCHLYYDLPNNTCLQLQVRETPKPEIITQITLGPEGYSDKLKWFKFEDDGKLKVFHEFELP